MWRVCKNVILTPLNIACSCVTSNCASRGVFVNRIFATLNHKMFIKRKCTLFFGAVVNVIDIYIYIYIYILERLTSDFLFFCQTRDITQQQVTNYSTHIYYNLWNNQYWLWSWSWSFQNAVKNNVEQTILSDLMNVFAVLTVGLYWGCVGKVSWTNDILTTRHVHALTSQFKLVIVITALQLVWRNCFHKVQLYLQKLFYCFSGGN
jgi:hypothetical protein